MAHPASLCPRCGATTGRRRFPVLLRPLRLLAPALQWRACLTCAWRGPRRVTPHRAEAPSREPRSS